MIESSNRKLQLGVIFTAAILAAGLSIYAAGSTVPSLLVNSSSPEQQLDLTKLVLPSADAANVDYFLKIDGIDGESTDDRHKGEIDIQSFSWGVSNQGSIGSTGLGSGKANFHDITIMKTVDKASPMLFLKAASGEHIKEMVLTGVITGANPTQFYVIKLQDVVISSFWQATPDGQLSMESVSFDFARIEIEYTPMSADGTSGEAIKAGYDLALNKKI